jgi:gliding motility-associated-like protein
VLVNVRPKLAGNILSSPDFSCTDKPVQISFQPIVEPLPGATYAWTLDDGVPSTSNLATPPQVIWSTPGQKNITLHIEESGCEETFYYQYTVYPDPLASFSATNASGCQPIEVSFNNSSSNLENPTYHWDFGDGNTDTGVNPSHIYPNPGTYDVTLTVTNSTGCINTLTVYDMVEVYEVPVADFEADPQAATIDNPTIHFTNLINIPFRIIEWDFGDGGTNTTEADPRHTYGAPGNYMVVMYTETEFGCWDRDTLEIGIVEDIKIFVPNAFTPDGDGLNDCFSVGGTTGDIIEVFQVIIYSRWGQQIHESKVENPECVWDGRDQQGNLLPPDTYIFRIFGKNFRGARKVYEGMVTIVK